MYLDKARDERKNKHDGGELADDGHRKKKNPSPLLADLSFHTALYRDVFTLTLPRAWQGTNLSVRHELRKGPRERERYYRRAEG